MANKNTNHTFKVSLQADKSLIPAGKAGARILEINLTAPSAVSDRPRVPLNLALVIDRSGSMHGEKLHFVKEAAAHVIDLLGEQDRAAVVIYDNQVETLFNSQLMTSKAKREAKAKIMNIQSGGSTYLYAGWLTGCREVAEAITDLSFNRTLLLTDGLANVGVRDVGTISMHAQELFTRNVSSSCFGVGSDYDEHMLETIANHGGGNFHFLETVQAIPLVFEREFDEIISVALKDVRVYLTLPDGVEARVSANWRSELERDQLTVFMGSLVADQGQLLYLRLSNLAGSAGSQLRIPVKVTGLDLDGVEQHIETEITFTIVPEAEEAASVQDAGLMERFAMVDMADQANEALKRERAGDRSGSSQLMQDALFQHQNFISDHTTEKYQRMASEMSMGYDPMDRKRRHYQEYQSKRGSVSIRDYQLSFSAGVPIAEIEGKAVFINTASPTSIAATPEIFFLNEVYTFQNEVNGMTCAELSKALGTRVDVMLGMDVLRDLHVRINPVHGVIQFSRQPFRSSGARLPLQVENVPPRALLKIGQEEIFMHLVTALKLNYIPGGLTVGLSEIGNASDSLPVGLAFSTPLYKLPVSIGRYALNLNCGIAPDALRGSLGLGVEEGVLGADLLQSLPVTLAFPDREMILFI